MLANEGRGAGASGGRGGNSGGRSGSGGGGHGGGGGGVGDTDGDSVVPPEKKRSQSRTSPHKSSATIPNKSSGDNSSSGSSNNDNRGGRSSDAGVDSGAGARARGGRDDDAHRFDVLLKQLIPHLCLTLHRIYVEHQ